MHSLLAMVGTHLLGALASKAAHIELRDNGIRISAGLLHQTIHWATLGALVKEHVHFVHLKTVATVLRQAADYVDNMRSDGGQGVDA